MVTTGIGSMLGNPIVRYGLKVTGQVINAGLMGYSTYNYLENRNNPNLTDLQQQGNTWNYTTAILDGIGMLTASLKMPFLPMILNVSSIGTGLKTGETYLEDYHNTQNSNSLQQARFSFVGAGLDFGIMSWNMGRQASLMNGLSDASTYIKNLPKSSQITAWENMYLMQREVKNYYDSIMWPDYLNRAYNTGLSIWNSYAY